MERKRPNSTAPLKKSCSLSKTAEKSRICHAPASSPCLCQALQPGRASPNQPAHSCNRAWTVPCACSQRQRPNLRVATLRCSWDRYRGFSVHSCFCIHKSQAQAALTPTLGGSAVALLLLCSGQSPWAIQRRGTAHKSTRRSWDREGKHV